MDDIFNYNRIAKAIAYIQENFRAQPTLEEIAAHVCISPFHFQRLFTAWAGTSPKQFLQFVSIEYAKKMLKDSKATLSETAFETGLSGTGRLHDLFVKIEGMTPAEYKQGGKDLRIAYAFDSTPFGRVLVASTVKGVCHLAFCDNEAQALAELQQTFERATLEARQDDWQAAALRLFRQGEDMAQIKLHLKGSDFQLKVWEALLKIPFGAVSTYANLACAIGKPAAARAVGTAIGANPVAFLIPCHRVIQASGAWGGYRWGETRKTAIIGWESARGSEILPAE